MATNQTILRNHKMHETTLFPGGHHMHDFGARAVARDYSAFWVQFARKHKGFSNTVFPKSPVVVGFAPFVSFSSMSPALCDGYNHQRHKRPFQLHMFPGVRFCQRKGGGDILSAMWVPERFRKPSVMTIWDAWHPVTLFEIFAECIAPITTTPDLFRVFDVEKRQYVSDVRDPEHLARRPVVPDGTLEKSHKACPMAYWINRFKILSEWALGGVKMCNHPPSNEQDCKLLSVYRQASDMYSGVFVDEPYGNCDMYRRFEIFRKMSIDGFQFDNLVSRPTLSPVVIEDSPEQAHWRAFGVPLAATDWEDAEPLFMSV